jgi:nucleotide-binding universal stress UspA family protein
LAGWKEKYPDVHVKHQVEHGKRRQLLLSSSQRGQLIVVGSRGRGGFAELVLGSSSQALPHHANRPVEEVWANLPGFFASERRL